MPRVRRSVSDAPGQRRRAQLGHRSREADSYLIDRKDAAKNRDQFAGSCAQEPESVFSCVDGIRVSAAS